jgi:hypothetical protein
MSERIGCPPFVFVGVRSFVVVGIFSRVPRHRLAHRGFLDPRAITQSTAIDRRTTIVRWRVWSRIEKTTSGQQTSPIAEH